MKTLKNHTIIYDDECPMCNLYTSAFLYAGMLDQDGREAFSNLKTGGYNLDIKRASNEIALVDKNDQTVTYGIYSLFKIVAHSFPFFKTLFEHRFFQLLVMKLYLFVSYNRKVIVPGKKFEAYNSCTPSLNMKYRVIYIIFAWAATSLILFYYSNLLGEFIPDSSISRELLICGAQVFFQGAIVGYFNKSRLIHYLGNLMTVSLGGAILLLPMLLLSKFTSSHMLFLTYFMIVMSVMLAEHIRRVKILELPLLISVTWVLYRILVVMALFA